MYLLADVEVDSDEEQVKVLTSRAGSERPSKAVASSDIAKAEMEQDSDDSIDWGSDSSESSDSSEDDAQYTSMRERFLKKYNIFLQFLKRLRYVFVAFLQGDR